MALEHLLNLVWTQSPPVVKRVKILREGLFALAAAIALVSIGHLAMFMSLRMTTDFDRVKVSSTLPNSHSFNSRSIFLIKDYIKYVFLPANR